MITVKVSGQNEVIASVGRLPAAVANALRKAMSAITVELKDYIISTKLSGQVLNHRSGDLWRSLQTSVTSGENYVTGKVYSDNTVKYAAIHEYGGVINHPGGTPYYFSKSLGRAFFVNKEDHPWLPVTRAHQIPMPERSFMRTGLRDFTPQIKEQLTAAVSEGIAAAGLK